MQYPLHGSASQSLDIFSDLSVPLSTVTVARSLGGQADWGPRGQGQTGGADSQGFAGKSKEPPDQDQALPAAGLQPTHSPGDRSSSFIVAVLSGGGRSVL